MPEGDKVFCRAVLMALAEGRAPAEAADIGEAALARCVAAQAGGLSGALGGS